MSSHLKRFGQLVSRLFAQTEVNEISWKLDSLDDSLETAVSKYRIILSEQEDEEGNPLYVIQIKSDLGTSIDIFSDSTLSSLIPEESGYNSYYVLMKDLYISARRKSVGADQALDDILNLLQDVPF